MGCAALAVAKCKLASSLAEDSFSTRGFPVQLPWQVVAAQANPQHASQVLLLQCFVQCVVFLTTRKHAARNRQRRTCARVLCGVRRIRDNIAAQRVPPLSPIARSCCRQRGRGIALSANSTGTAFLYDLVGPFSLDLCVGQHLLPEDLVSTGRKKAASRYASDQLTPSLSPQRPHRRYSAAQGFLSFSAERF